MIWSIIGGLTLALFVVAAAASVLRRDLTLPPDHTLFGLYNCPRCERLSWNAICPARPCLCGYPRPHIRSLYANRRQARKNK